jgi:type IV pilus assembly protein PilF
VIRIKLSATCAAVVAVLVLAACSTTIKQSEFGGDITQPSTPADAKTRARIHTELGAAYFQAGQMPVAVQELKEAIRIAPDYGPAYIVLGLSYMDLKEDELARANFEQALKLMPGDSDANNNYGWFLCQSGKPQESIAYFMAALKNPLYQTPQKAWLNAGLCSMKLNDMARADEYLQRAVNLDPNQAQALINLSLLRYREGRLNDARTYVARYNKLVDPTSESLWLAMRIEHKAGDLGAEQSFGAQLRRAFSGSREYQDFLRGNYE